MDLIHYGLILALVLFGLPIVGCGPKNDQNVPEDATIQDASEPDEPEPEPFEEEPKSHEILLVRDVVLNFIQDQIDVSFLGLDWKETRFAKIDYSFSAEGWEVMIDTGINLFQERVYWVTLENGDSEFEWKSRAYPGGDVEEGPHGILSALNSAILAVNISIPDEAPAKLLVWVGEDIAYMEYEFVKDWLYTSDEWEIHISYVFVGEGTPIYAITAVSNQPGFLWFSKHDADWNLLAYRATQWSQILYTIHPLR